MKRFWLMILGSVFGFFAFAKSMYASFMSDIATSVGSGATAEVSEVIAWPIGSIIFYVLAILLIGFVVTTITMWVRSGRRK